ncbi:MAG: hypothetical protein C0602_06405 [Denitrovibrio sp.]|nr:MAG: hypothetical protein C0602_06405 [Denitrovibrio sp.]
MAEIIAVANHKGGVGKTATSVNLSAIIASKNKKVLLIDMDPQGSSSSWIGSDNKSDSLYNSVYNAAPLETEKTEFKNLDIVSGSYSLATVENKITGTKGSEFNLYKSILKLKEKYSYIFIDCPPGLGFLTVSAISASSGILLPLEAHPLSLRGIVDMKRIISAISSRSESDVDILGIVPCRVHTRRALHKEVMESLEKSFPNKITPVIRENVSLAEAPAHCKPINIYAPKSNGSMDYKKVAAWVMKNTGGV